MQKLTDSDLVFQEHKEEVVEYLVHRGFTVREGADALTLVVSKNELEILTFWWDTEKEAWSPWFMGPPIRTLKDLDVVINSANANEETLRLVDKTWEVYLNHENDENWMSYLGSQCPFYQKANTWGSILDEMSEDLEAIKKLALKAADMLWNRGKGHLGYISLNDPSMSIKPKTQGFTVDDLFQMNQKIYDLLGKIGYPEKEKKND